MSVDILLGDCREVLRTLPDESVHCCVSSPPYFGLRDYGVAGQIGLEATPWDFVHALTDVFREVRRILRPDGTCWVNLGDSYAGSWGARGRGEGTNAPRPDLEVKHGTVAPGRNGFRAGNPDKNGGASNRDGVGPVADCKPKDLIGTPWLVAFALRADGWYLRQDIIWSKPNPMPESVRDRCTKAHEYLFLLAKSERYFYDADAIAEDVAASSVARVNQNGGNPVWNGDRTRSSTQNPQTIDIKKMVRDDGKRNKRSVWDVPTQSFPDAHFATFPPALIKPCILAGCPAGGTVLDPFGGAGTTGLVADRHGRNAILIELNPEYAAMARRRIERDGGMFANVKSTEITNARHA